MPLTQSIPQSHHSLLSAAGQLGPVSINSSHNIPHQGPQFTPPTKLLLNPLLPSLPPKSIILIRNLHFNIYFQFSTTRYLWKLFWSGNRLREGAVYCIAMDTGQFRRRGALALSTLFLFTGFRDLEIYLNLCFCGLLKLAESLQVTDIVNSSTDFSSAVRANTSKQG